MFVASTLKLKPKYKKLKNSLKTIANRIEILEKKIKEQQEEISRLKKKTKSSGFFLFYLLGKADGSFK